MVYLIDLQVKVMMFEWMSERKNAIFEGVYQIYYRKRQFVFIRLKVYIFNVLQSWSVSNAHVFPINIRIISRSHPQVVNFQYKIYFT